MKNLDETIEQVRKLKIKFTTQGCTYESFLSFIINNADFLLEKDNIHNKIYFLYNHKELYGIIFTDNESYTWCRYENKEFQQLRKITFYHQDMTNEDFIIEMAIRFAESEKVKNIVPEIHNMNIEGKVKMLKKIGLNSKGYHFK